MAIEIYPAGRIRTVKQDTEPVLMDEDEFIVWVRTTDDTVWYVYRRDDGDQVRVEAD